MSETALEITEVAKAFGGNGRLALPSFFRRSGAKKKRVMAVDHVSLTVHRGEIFGVLGPNGSGKSTLVRLMATLLIPDGGTIRVFGHDVVRESEAVKRMINRVSVEAAFFKKLSPMENLMYAARLYGLSGGEARRKIVAILARLGIEGRSVYSPLDEMSRGMQQKVAIARAFLTSPVLLLLDEPTTGLDPRSKRDVQQFVRELRDSHDTTVVLTTHDMNEAETLCDRVAIIDEGRIVALDTPAGLKAQLPVGDRSVTLEDVFMELTGKRLVGEEVVI
ncbi:MAG: ABC transporter ATP-binding protein [Anaerolineae bacterium]|nr:ABC transporter ATP-binding protein [Anaerolineae bacterium]